MRQVGSLLTMPEQLMNLPPISLNVCPHARLSLLLRDDAVKPCLLQPCLLSNLWDPEDKESNWVLFSPLSGSFCCRGVLISGKSTGLSHSQGEEEGVYSPWKKKQLPKLCFLSAHSGD